MHIAEGFLPSWHGSGHSVAGVPLGVHGLAALPERPGVPM